MSAQCWCYTCAGRVVSRSVFYRHGRKDVPDPPVRMAACMERLVPDAPLFYDMPASAPSNLDTPELPDEASLDPLGLNDVVPDEERSGRAGLSSAELTLFVLDWMSSHKCTDNAARDVYNICKMLMPAGVTPKTFDQIKYILKKYEGEVVQTIDICPNDCVAYWNSTFLPEKYRHAHRSKCPVCDTPRFVTDPQDGSVKSAKVPIYV